MARRKPAQHVPKPEYKDVWRMFIVCDNRHEYHEDWDSPLVNAMFPCPTCGAPTELDWYGDHTRCDARAQDGLPWRHTEVPADTAVLCLDEEYVRQRERWAAASHGLDS